MNRNVKANRVCDPDYLSGGLLHFFNRYYFGKIVDDQMILSEIRTIVQQYWNAIPTHFPFVELGEFVVMPNHLHGIIIIDKTDDGRYNKSTIIETPSIIEMPSIVETPSVVETPNLGVSTHPAQPNMTHNCLHGIVNKSV